MPRCSNAHFCAIVALLAEGVDRNKLTKVTTGWGAVVALLAEGVDRNPPG